MKEILIDSACREVLYALRDGKPHFVEKLRHEYGGVFKDMIRTVETISLLCEKELIKPVEVNNKFPIAITDRGLTIYNSMHNFKKYTGDYPTTTVS